MSEEDESYRELKRKTARHEKEIIKTKLRGIRTQQMFNYYSCKKIITIPDFYTIKI